MENFLYLLIPLCAGWLLDKRFGDPSKLPHPIVFFGHLIASGEQKLNHGENRFWKGAMTSVTLIAGTFLSSFIICSMLSTKNIGTLQFWIYIIVASILVFYCLAG
ncbi:MAG: cobalamin biosynthesis protein, partial [Tannerella sp.]|nr:cobalamin biosynthesis protein [Tannerella sp.]